MTGLAKSFSAGGLRGRGARTVAAREVEFRVAAGECVALVGESGSGKSTIARLLLRLLPADGGHVCLAGEDVLGASSSRRVREFRRRVQMVFQDPFASLNPAHDVAHHLVRPLVRLRPRSRGAGGVGGGAGIEERALALLRTVGLEPAAEFLHRRPFELSGGQRQRVAIARALAAEPDLLVADEPTSMLDVSIRMGILELLAGLKRERGLAILLITHDLTAARFLADRILVLYKGRVVEEGPVGALVAAPLHPYTRALLAAVGPESVEARDSRVAAARPDAPAGARAVGCAFAPRCPQAFAPCGVESPAPRTVDGRRVRCHLYPATPEGPRP